MENLQPNNRLSSIVLLTLLLFVAGRFVGENLGSNTWSFTHWNHLPTWYLIAWFIAAPLILIVLGRFLPPIAAFLESRRNRITTGIALLVILYLARFDSFVYGGGNIEIARIAQAQDVIFRPWEYGTMALVYMLDSLWSLSPVSDNAAGVYAWQTFAILCTILSMLGAWHLAKALTDNPARRLGLFLVMFFGPHIMLLFAFVGAEPLIPAATLWFAVFGLRTLRRFSLGHLLSMWLIVVIGAIFSITLLYLLPAAVFFTISGLDRRRSRPAVAAGLSLLALLLLAVFVYVRAADSPYLASAILLLSGKNPLADYGLFSIRHLSDYLQLVFLLFPLILALLFLLIRNFRPALGHGPCLAAGLMTLSGLSLIFILDPIHGIVFDVPRFAAYLTPGAIFLALLLNERPPEAALSPAAIGLTAAVSLIAPLSYYPAYADIESAEHYVAEYFDKHPAYYRTAVPTLRDAFFYNRNFDRANYWDQNYRLKSPDYLNYTGIVENAEGGRLSVALPSLTKLIARNPYWSELRNLYAKYMIQQGQLAVAKPHIDTALMLTPYRPDPYINLYAYYRDRGEFTDALEIAREAAAMFPNDSLIPTDVMLLNYRAGNLDRALELSDQLVAEDSTNAWPWLVKGFLAERTGNLARAVEHYEKFADLAPNEPESPQIRKHANELYLQLRGDK